MTVENSYRLKYIICDFVSGSIAWSLFNLIRYYTLPYNYELISLHLFFSIPNILWGQFLFPLMMVVLYAISGYYNNVYFKSRLEEVANSYGIALIGVLIIFFVALFNDTINDRLRNYEMIVILWALWGTFTVFPRNFITLRLVRRISSRQICFNTLIVGVSDKARRMAESLSSEYPRMGFNVVGFVDAKHLNSYNKNFMGLPVTPISEIDKALERDKVDSLVIVNDSDDPHDTVLILNQLLPSGKSIYITPDILHFITNRPKTRMISGAVLIDVSHSRIPASTLNIKRIVDVAVSTVALTVLALPMGVIALLVKRDSAGPVIYRQERLGRNKKPFYIYKFRSMYIDSEVGGPALSSANDKRITPIGHVLRKYRLDELPQFYNVLKGDMSLVGPRPERAYFMNQILEKAPYFTLLHQVRPGITSWGMVKYGYASTVDQMIERANYDLLYIENMSMIVDAKILLYTIETIFTGKGV